MGFPTPTSPLAPLQMIGGDGERVESSDEEDGDDDDDDDEDEFEDSEPTEATVSEGELSATPERGSNAADKWVAVKGQALEHPSMPPPPPSPQPQMVLPGAVAEAVVPVLSR